MSRRSVAAALSNTPPAVARIMAAAIALCIVCFLLRVKMALFGIPTWLTIKRAILSGSYNTQADVAVCIALTAVFALLATATRWRPAVSRAIASAFVAACVFGVLLASINVIAVRWLGGSLTYQWLQYADLLRSFTSQSVVLAHLDPSDLAMTGSALIVFAVFYKGLRIGISRLIDSRRMLRAAVVASGLFAVYMTVAVLRVHRDAESAGRVTNPLWELVKSAVMSPATALAQVDNPIPYEEPPLPTHSQAHLPLELARAPIKNVVLVVMESVGANYVAGTGPERAASWTPNIARYLDKSIVFNNFYANVPLSTKSLYALLASRYPVLSYQLETVLFKDKQLELLPEQFRKAGARSSFFMSGDFEFQHVDEFLVDRGFDHRSDMRTIQCDNKNNEHGLLFAADDTCTARALTQWIAANKGSPFFSIMWTGNTHTPYYPSDPVRTGEFSNDERQNRYISAIRSSDRAIGMVLDYLEAESLLDDTLVVVTGDHGDAFGEHGRYYHGTDIYDEQTKIPLLFVNGRIKAKSVLPTPGSMVDLGPTILHVLGRGAKSYWDGRSLFEPVRSRQIFLFAPSQDLIVGYREGSKKFIAELSWNRFSKFDLETDPGETRNIADENTADVVLRTLAGWQARQAARDARSTSQEMTERNTADGRQPAHVR